MATLQVWKLQAGQEESPPRLVSVWHKLMEALIARKTMRKAILQTTFCVFDNIISSNNQIKPARV